MQVPRREAFDSSTLVVGIVAAVCFAFGGIVYYGADWGWLAGLFGGPLAALAVAEAKDANR